MILKVIFSLCAVGLATAQLPDNFRSLSAADKMNVMWKNVVDGAWPNPPPISVVPGDQLNDATFVCGAFDQSIEEFWAGRNKTVGTNGVNAKAVLKIYPNSSYTGIFKANTENTGILRLASNTGTNLLMYVTMKIFIDGNYSQHLHQVHDISGWGIETADLLQWSLFSDGPQPLPGDFASGRFSQAMLDPFNVCIKNLPGGPLDRPPSAWGLGQVEMARIDSKGHVEPTVAAPWNLQFTPNQALRPINVQVYKEDWRLVFIPKVPAYTLLYTVQAKRSPCDPWLDIGTITTTSDFVASAYGDQKLRMGQPTRKWSYADGAPGIYCNLDPDALQVWSDAEANETERVAVGPFPPTNNYGNAPAAILSLNAIAGHGTAAAPASRRSREIETPCPFAAKIAAAKYKK